jgi:hypothetical protein
MPIYGDGLWKRKGNDGREGQMRTELTHFLRQVLKLKSTLILQFPIVMQLVTGCKAGRTKVGGRSQAAMQAEPRLPTGHIGQPHQGIN